MKNNYQIIIFIIASSLLLLQCKKKVDKVDLNYIGTWRASHGDCFTRITISQKSKGEYATYGSSMECDSDLKGNVRIGKKKMRIGIYNFEILESPTPIDTTIYYYSDTIKSYWRMKLKKPKLLVGYEVVLYKIPEN